MSLMEKARKEDGEAWHTSQRRSVGRDPSFRELLGVVTTTSRTEPGGDGPGERKPSFVDVAIRKCGAV
jgi:hypothetical protein